MYLNFWTGTSILSVSSTSWAGGGTWMNGTESWDFCWLKRCLEIFVKSWVELKVHVVSFCFFKPPEKSRNADSVLLVSPRSRCVWLTWKGFMFIISCTIYIYIYRVYWGIYLATVWFIRISFWTVGSSYSLCIISYIFESSDLVDKYCRNIDHLTATIYIYQSIHLVNRLYWGGH